MPIDHEFGDQHTELKLSIVEKYLKFFTTALRGKFKELWYIDAFAGTGSRTVRHEERAAGLLDSGEPERIERRRGSARIAVDVKPPFDFKPPYVAALQELAANYPNRQIVVIGHQDRQSHTQGRQFIIGAATQQTTSGFLVFAAPLLKEKRCP
jgi:three-Cys-motif partner protein